MGKESQGKIETASGGEERYFGRRPPRGDTPPDVGKFWYFGTTLPLSRRLFVNSWFFCDYVANVGGGALVSRPSGLISRIAQAAGRRLV